MEQKTQVRFFIAGKNDFIRVVQFVKSNSILLSKKNTEEDWQTFEVIEKSSVNEAKQAFYALALALGAKEVKTK